MRLIRLRQTMTPVRRVCSENVVYHLLLKTAVLPNVHQVVSQFVDKVPPRDVLPEQLGVDRSGFGDFELSDSFQCSFQTVGCELVSWVPWFTGSCVVICTTLTISSVNGGEGKTTIRPTQRSDMRSCGMSMMTSTMSY